MESRFGFAVAALTALGVLTFGPVLVEAADPVPITNQSFEDPALGENNYTAPACFGDPICVQTPTPVAGWVVGGGSAGTWRPTNASYPGGVPDGSNVAYANGGPATISQVLGSVATANTLYKLEVDIGNRNGANFPGYTVQLWAGAELLAEDVNSLTPANGTFETSVLEVLVGFSTGVGESLEIVLISQGSQTNFDNVKLTSDAGGISPDVPFYAVLDGETRRTVATNGVLQLIAFCDPAANEVGLLMTSTADGWFSTKEIGSLAAGQEVVVGSLLSPVSRYLNSSSSGASAVGPDGSYLGLALEATGFGIDIFGHDCIAVGTATTLTGDVNGS